MGFKLTSRVYAEITNTTPTEQAILAYLAFRADDETGKCFPTRDTIQSATHFGMSGVTNGLNGLREKNILKWNKGGRKSKSGGRALANEYFFNFSKLSTKKSADKESSSTICHDATYAYATRQPMHMPRRNHHHK